LQVSSSRDLSQLVTFPQYDSQKASTPGPSHGQLNVLITIARAQLALFQQGRPAKVGHPEAAIQRAAQHAVMDTLPW
jgi:hypothetical protein